MRVREKEAREQELLVKIQKELQKSSSGIGGKEQSVAVATDGKMKKK